MLFTTSTIISNCNLCSLVCKVPCNTGQFIMNKNRSSDFCTSWYKTFWVSEKNSFVLFSTVLTKFIFVIFIFHCCLDFIYIPCINVEFIIKYKKIIYIYIWFIITLKKFGLSFWNQELFSKHSISYILVNFKYNKKQLWPKLLSPRQ